jgi:hypothetical protein
MDPFEMFTVLGVTAIVVGSFTRVVVVFLNRNRGATPALARTNDMDQRLQRIEQSLDAVALEVERISEGQRFTTRLLSERSAQSATAQGATPPGSGAGRDLS